jgi:8-oxo-dGTP pyrophosphatase MutT (NUDIX family)
MLAADVRVLVERFAPSDAREAGFRERMLALTTHAAPFARTSFDPGHFTASAFVLSPERDALALIFHKKLRLWLQPGGHVEASDATVADAARREVVEETGLDGLVLASDGLFDIDVHAIPAHGAESAHEHFDLRVLFVAKHARLRASEEVEGARWVPLGDVAAITTDESVQRAVRKIRVGG